MFTYLYIQIKICPIFDIGNNSGLYRLHSPKTLCPFKITRTEIHELSCINKIMLMNPLLEHLNNYRLILSVFLLHPIQVPL